MKKRKILFILGFICSLFCANSSYAIDLDFGGYDDRFRGGGDHEPPECQINYPLSASAPFVIKWNCEDNDAPQENITTELWMYRNNSPRSFLVDTFLGFPAAAGIDENLLGVNIEDFADELPLTFRLVARDRAGSGSISPKFVVTKQSSVSGITKCSINITTEATETTETTTGIPELSVTSNSIDVSSQNTGTLSLRINSPISAKASPCEIDSICTNDDLISLTINAESSTSGVLSGTAAISPGNVSVEISGTAEITNGTTISGLSAEGSTVIDELNATLEVSCEN